AASRYLSKSHKVVLVDPSDGAGGMWNRTYSYVRLHQPHAIFTAGNIRWSWDRDPAYLADRSEVVAHLRHCLAELKRNVNVDERFGYRYERHQESADGVRVHCDPPPGGRPLVVEAKRLVKALGYNIRPHAAFTVSSVLVRSVSPDSYDLAGEELQASS